MWVMCVNNNVFAQLQTYISEISQHVPANLSNSNYSKKMYSE